MNNQPVNARTYRGPEVISFGGVDFKHVHTRPNMPVSIFHHEGRYLRAGPEELIASELAFHRKLFSLGFPVAEILEEGRRGDLCFYVERSLGDLHFGEQFATSFEQTGRIEEAAFTRFLDLVNAVVEAQLRSRNPSFDTVEFFKGIHLDSVQRERPDMKEKLERSFQKIVERIGGLPGVVTHGDFNAHNILDRGVIDFGCAFIGPAGYDAITALVHIENFPRDGDYEMRRGYEFSLELRRRYLEKMDATFIQAGLPELSRFAADLELAKMIWSAAGMQRDPKIQRWRYQRLERALDAYLGR